MLTIKIPIEPKGQGRARATMRGKHARMYKASKDVQYEGTLRQYFETAMQGREIPQGPIFLEVTTFSALAKSKYRKTKPVEIDVRRQKPDIDNIIKAVMDAGNGILWLDDVQVWQVRAAKFTAAQGVGPSVTVTVDEEYKKGVVPIG